MLRSAVKAFFAFCAGLVLVMVACVPAARAPNTTESVAGVLQSSCRLASTSNPPRAAPQILPYSIPSGCQATDDPRSGARVYPRFECLCGDRCIASFCSAVEMALAACDTWTSMLEMDRVHATVTFLEHHGGLSYHYSLGSGALVGVSESGSVVITDDEPSDAAVGTDGDAAVEGGDADVVPNESYLSANLRAGEQVSKREPLVRCRICGAGQLDAVACDRHIWDGTIPRPEPRR